MGIIVRVQTYDRRPARSQSGHKRRGHNRYKNFLFQLEREDVETSDEVQAVLDAGGSFTGWHVQVASVLDLGDDGGDPACLIVARHSRTLRQVDVRRLLTVGVRVVEIEEEYV